MSGPSHNFHNNPNNGSSRDPNHPHFTYARAAASSSRTRSGSSSRTGPASFSNILNPADGDGNTAYISTTARNGEGAGTMTQNGSNLEGPAATGLYTAPTHQLPESSRSFEPFMTRATLDTLTGIDSVFAGRTDPLPGMTTATGSSSSSSSIGGGGGSSSYSFPRPSYLEGSHFLARLEQQERQRALALRETNGSSGLHAPAANGAGGPHLGQSGAGGKPPGNPSYLGIARDVVERTPSHEFGGGGGVSGDEEALVDPLPTRWSSAKEDRAAGLEVLGDGLEVKYTGSRSASERDHEACAIRADRHMPLQCGLYYFEVTILSRKHTDTTIGIGFSSKSVSLSRAPGWEPESWGFHGDDGHIFASQNVGKHYGEPFSSGDTIGCGVNFGTSSAFFTKNGKFLGQAFKEVKGKLYPSVGMKKSGEHVRVNFGQTPFIFDIDALMKKEIHRLEEEIARADTSRLAPPLGETELIQQLVLQFLQHDGYVETARAFAGEIQSEKQSLCLEPGVQIPGIDIRDDEDANNRQRIRRAILEGDIDKALKHTNAFYPQVLKENEHVFFRLKCRKFIEMIRREAEINLVGGDKRSHNNGNSRVPPTDEDMELDEDVDDFDGQLESSGGTGDLTQVALLYGQSLQAEYASDERREVRTALEEIFSLVAYQNPLKEAKVAHLLERKGRVAVAEELNSAILQSLGKSSRAALENVYAQTSVLLDDLAETGGPGAFVTLKAVIDEVELNKPEV